MLVRSWNVFHGNASPPQRRSHLERMVRLATADAPDVLCLQELPVWSLRRLEGWSGMSAVTDVARAPRLPVPVDRAVTLLDNGLFRSLFAGQAQAILLRRELELLERSVYVLNEGRFPGVGVREPRVCQIVRLRTPANGTVVLCNLHASNPADRAAEQVERAAGHVLELAGDDETVVLAGDFNATADLRHHGFGEGGPGIDHVLVRGDDPSPLHVWPVERRTVNGTLLSDHAPVERSLR
ncbi:MAG TPA: endonuclease/exonuclease/phosphatase family protein [Gaiellaceae bacterium]|nr:endonuclease/exonuclease/phosphatase family protein [Gaiellaceae bacterium]